MLSFGAGGLKAAKLFANRDFLFLSPAPKCEPVGAPKDSVVPVSGGWWWMGKGRGCGGDGLTWSGPPEILCCLVGGV